MIINIAEDCIKQSENEKEATYRKPSQTDLEDADHANTQTEENSTQSQIENDGSCGHLCPQDTNSDAIVNYWLVSCPAPFMHALNAEYDRP